MMTRYTVMKAKELLATEPSETLLTSLWVGEDEFPGVRSLYQGNRAAQPRINGHIYARHKLPTLEGLRSSDHIELVDKVDTMKTVCRALIRHAALGVAGTDPKGKWDAGLLGTVPSGQVEGGEDILPPPPASVTASLDDEEAPTRKAVSKRGTKALSLPETDPLMVALRAAQESDDEEQANLLQGMVNKKVLKLEEERAKAEAAAAANAVSGVKLDELRGEFMTKLGLLSGTMSTVAGEIESIKTEHQSFMDGVRSVIEERNKEIIQQFESKSAGIIDEAKAQAEDSLKLVKENTAKVNTFSATLSSISEHITRLASKPAAASSEKVKLDPDDIRKQTAEILNAQVKDIIGTGNPASVVVVMEDGDRLANAFVRPAVDPSFKFVEEDYAELLGDIRTKAPQNLMLEGPQGCGKTTWPVQLAARLNLPVLLMDCANMKDERMWFGFRDPLSFKWIRSAFDLAIEAGDCVIVLDEISRGTPRTLNGLFSVLDWRQRVFVEERGEATLVKKGIIFVATRNKGNEFTGTMAMDAALNDRFPRRIKVTYLTPDEEAEVLVQRTGIDGDNAIRLAELARDIRAKSGSFGSGTLMGTVSTRQLVAAAGDFKWMRDKHPSDYTKADSDHAQVLQLVQAKFGAL